MNKSDEVLEAQNIICLKDCNQSCFKSYLGALLRTSRTARYGSKEVVVYSPSRRGGQDSCGPIKERTKLKELTERTELRCRITSQSHSQSARSQPYQPVTNHSTHS